MPTKKAAPWEFVRADIDGPKAIEGDALSNLSGNINRQKKRLASLRQA